MTISTMPIHSIISCVVVPLGAIEAVTATTKTPTATDDVEDDLADRLHRVDFHAVGGRVLFGGTHLRPSRSSCDRAISKIPNAAKIGRVSSALRLNP